MLGWLFANVRGMKPRRFSRREGIISARRRAGLTQAELAEKIGRTRHAVAMVEVGRKDPSFASAVQWAETLGVSLDAWVLDVDEQESAA